MRWRQRSQNDFEDEIRSHLELETDRLIAEGASPTAARLQARRRFGNVGGAQERFYYSGHWAWLDPLVKDVRFAARALRKAPGFSAIAIVTLALGIGANTAVFSVVKSVLLTPLPYREPDRLVTLWETLPGLSRAMISYPDYKDWRVRNRVFDDVALYSPFRTMSLTLGELPERVGVGYASDNLFGVLGVAPVVGRGFRADEDQPGAARVALLTNGWWKRRFAADTGVIGKTLPLDGELYKVVGVLPPTVGIGFVDVWVPVGLFANTESFTRANHPGLIGIGRLKPGVSLDQMKADLGRISAELRAEYPKDNAGIGASGEYFRELLVMGIRPALKMFSWAVALVFLIACVNVANLLLGRATGRKKEIALRTAMGASDSRIIRLLLAENVLLALAGGVLGVALAYAGLRGLVALRPAGVPRLGEIRIDLTVLAFAAAVSVFTGLLFGLIPARQVSRVDLNDTLKESGRATSSGGATTRLRTALMTVEVAMALMLLVGAGLLMRSFARLTQVDPGVDPRGVITAWVNLPYGTYPNEARQREVLNEMLRRAQSIPGVTSAALTSALPLGANIQNKITFEGHPRPKGNEPLINIQFVTRDYFSTMKMRVLAGRGLNSTDAPGNELAALMSESVAKTFFAGENPIGKRLVHGAFDSSEPPWRVVGIVNDVKDRSLGARTSGTIYLAFDQQPQAWMALVVRTSLSSAQILPALRREVAGVDKALPLANEALLTDVIDQSVGQQRFTMFVLGVFAVVSLMLAAVGVYGVISYHVAQRGHEIGIRMALGAQRADIVSLVTGRALITAGAGIVIGAVAAAAVSGLIRSLLFEVAPTDATTYAAGAAALLVTAALAAVVPTIRATRVNPVETIRAN